MAERPLKRPGMKSEMKLANEGKRKRHRFTIEVDEDLHQYILKVAAERNLAHPQDLIREAIWRHLSTDNDDWAAVMFSVIGSLGRHLGDSGYRWNHGTGKTYASSDPGKLSEINFFIPFPKDGEDDGS